MISLSCSRDSMRVASGIILVVVAFLTLLTWENSGCVQHVQAWTFQNHQSFARKSAVSSSSSLYMNIGNVATKPNIKVGVIGRYNTPSEKKDFFYTSQINRKEFYSQYMKEIIFFRFIFVTKC